METQVPQTQQIHLLLVTFVIFYILEVTANSPPTTSEDLGYLYKTVLVGSTDTVQWDISQWSDPNFDTITYTFISNTTGFATFDSSTLTITINPTTAAQNGEYSVGVKASDPQGAYTEEKITVYITDDIGPIMVSEMSLTLSIHSK